MVIPLLIAFALPATAAVIYVTFRPLWRHTTGPSEVDGTYKAITLHTVLFVLVLYALALATLADVPGVRPIAPRAVAVLVGLFFVAVGNLLPRTRPNLLIGIRTSRTLEDRELWARMHRTCGYLCVGFGIVVAVASAFLSRDGIQAAVSAAGVTCAIALPVSYWMYSTPAHMTVAERRGRRLDAAVWILRIALASIFVVVGFVKIPGSIHPMWVRLFERIGFGQWFRYFTALVEIVGGMLMLVPSATLVSVLLLASTVAGALLVHIFVIGVGTQTVVVITLLAGITAVICHHRKRSLNAHR
jgi:putative oxidoreductase